jgi:hypothetical protein
MGGKTGEEEGKREGCGRGRASWSVILLLSLMHVELGALSFSCQGNITLNECSGKLTGRYRVILPVWRQRQQKK